MKSTHSVKARAGKGESNPPMEDELNYQDILRIVGGWSITLRAALARDILTLPTEQVELDERRQNALAKLRGFLKTEEPPPSDEQVKQWLEERTEKYG